MRDLCLAGGVALNCVGNGRVLREGPFEQIWIQPAAGDAGGALGVAMSLWHRHLEKPRTSPEAPGTWERPRRRQKAKGRRQPTPKYADGMSGSYPRSEVQRSGDRGGDSARAAGSRRASSPNEVAAHRGGGHLAAEKVVGLMQGRMEFGPRALGGRSILGDARSPKMQAVMNLKIKFRESFRPFAPAVMREHVADWFELDGESPYMLLVADVKPDRRLPVPAGSREACGASRS